MNLNILYFIQLSQSFKTHITVCMKTIANFLDFGSFDTCYFYVLFSWTDLQWHDGSVLSFICCILKPQCNVNLVSIEYCNIHCMHIFIILTIIYFYFLIKKNCSETITYFFLMSLSFTTDTNYWIRKRLLLWGFFLVFVFFVLFCLCFFPSFYFFNFLYFPFSSFNFCCLCIFCLNIIYFHTPYLYY